jgi:hypothetical protein
LNARSAWNSQTTDYALNDVVTDAGSTWRCKIAACAAGNEPATNPSQWELLAAKGDTGPAGPIGPQGPAGNGSVTSVAAGTGLTGGPITTTGALYLDTNYTDARYSQLNFPNTFTGHQTVNGKQPLRLRHVRKRERVSRIRRQRHDNG